MTGPSAPLSFTEESAVFQNGTPTASCTPSGGVPTGEASPAEPFTVCCAADSPR
ncbi:MAG: hypothetical protein IAG13_16185 [Deltaproteobacteria bacterium]|nr:hypothetical protein [Nannocystaceae bacterium]